MRNCRRTDHAFSIQSAILAANHAEPAEHVREDKAVDLDSEVVVRVARVVPLHVQAAVLRIVPRLRRHPCKHMSVNLHAKWRTERWVEELEEGAAVLHVLQGIDGGTRTSRADLDEQEDEQQLVQHHAGKERPLEN